MAERSLKVPWVKGLRKPNFIFYRLKFSIPTRVPPSFIYGFIYLSVLYIFAGGVYDLVEEPFARGADQNGNPVLIWPDQDRQFLIEGIVAGLIMFMGAAGLYLIFQATTDPHNPSRATNLQVFGGIIVAFAYIILQSMYNAKTG